MTKEEQIADFRQVLSGDDFQSKRPRISSEDIPFCMSTNDFDVTWLFSQEEAEAILHEYAPELFVELGDCIMIISAHPLPKD